MTNEELLEKIRLDRPNQIIHEVLSYKETKAGYLEVDVIMPAQFFDTIVSRTHMTLPYPLEKYMEIGNMLSGLQK